MRAPRCLALAALVGTAFWIWHPVLRMSFASDSFLLPLLLGPGGGVDWQAVLGEWSRPWLGMQGAATWRPVVTAHFALDLWLFGADPLGFHLSNLACHLASGALVFALIRRALPGAGLFAAWVGAFLYLVHPARAEAVAWVPGRVDGTAALFVHGAALAFLRSGEARGRSGGLLWGAASLLLALAAYGAKEMALALPATLVLLRWARPRALRPARVLLGLQLVLLAGVAAWRIRILGGVAGGSGLAALAGDYTAGLPAKLAWAFFPEAAGAPLLRFLGWIVLPLCSAWVRGLPALRALPCLGWWCLLLVPASSILIHPDGSGSRQLLLPALAGGVLAAALLGRPAPGRDLWPGNAVRFAAGGAMCALAFLGARQRMLDWLEATELADRTRAAVASRPAGPGQGPLAIAPLPVRTERQVQPFRHDCAFLAFRRPFAAEDQEVLVLDRALGWHDAGPLHQASTVCRELLAWMPGAGGFVDQKAAERKDEELDLLGLDLDPETCRRVEGSVVLASGNRWTWLRLPAIIRSSASIEGIDLQVEAPEPGLEVVLAWFDPGGPGAELPPVADPGELGPHHHARFYPVDSEARLWRAACGNRAGFFALHLWGRPIPAALALKGEARLVGLAWRGRLPRAAWSPTPGTRVDPDHPSLPVPPGFLGPCRLVLLTPSQVVEVFYRGSGQDSVPLGPEALNVLAFVARAVPGSRVYYYIDRLAVPEARHTTLDRTGTFAHFALKEAPPADKVQSAGTSPRKKNEP